jgi:hypothetical protein
MGHFDQFRDIDDPMFHQAVGMLAQCLDVSVVEAEARLRSQSIAAGRTTRSVAADIVARRLTMNLSGLSAVEPNPGEHPAT